MDARTNVLGPVLQEQSLPDTTYYVEDHPQREELLTLEASTTNLFSKLDFSGEEIADPNR